MQTPVKIGFVVAIVIAFAVSVKVLRDRLPEAQGNIKIVARLDEHTTTAGPDVANTIPTFLALPGVVGILPDPVTPPADATAAAPAAVPAAPVPATPVTPERGIAPPAETTPPAEAAPAPAADAPASEATASIAIQPISETELQKGFCTVSLTKLVRQRYPGTYDDIPDSDLEKSVLKQHPEYKGRICVFPVWITANPHTIVKYEIERGVTAIPTTIWMWSGAIAAVFGIALLVAYKKFVEEPPVAKPKPARSSSRPRDRATP